MIALEIRISLIVICILPAFISPRPMPVRLLRVLTSPYDAVEV